MVRDFLKRPSAAVVGWAAVVVVVFVVRGDLRVETTPAAAAVPEVPRAPLVVKNEPGRTRPAAATTLRRGRVFDTMGFLVVGAEVFAAERAAGRTDADGAFRVQIAEDRVTSLLVRAPGRQPAWAEAVASSPDPLVLQLAPAAPWDVDAPVPTTAAATLRGEGLVQTEAGKPVAGAFVTALGSPWWARTDELGRYTLPLASPSGTLVAHVPDAALEPRGLAARVADLTLPRAQGVVPLPGITVSPAGAIRGTLRDPNGTPITGALVQVVGNGLSRLLETGVGGIFRLAGLLPGEYDVTPWAFRGAVGRATRITVAGGFVDCDVHLADAEERRLRVLDEKGAPVGGVFVAASVGGQRRGVAQADADGWAAVPVAADTAFDVRTAPDHVPMVVRRFAEPATLVVALP